MLGFQSLGQNRQRVSVRDTLKANDESTFSVRFSNSRKGRDVIKQVFTEKDILLKLKSDFVIKLFGTFKTTDEIFFVLR